jgi:uncharacterized protein
MRLKLYVAIAVLGIVPSAAYFNEASKTAKAEELFRVAKMDEMLRQSLAIATEQVKSGLIQQVMGVKLPPGLEKDFAAFQDKIARTVSDALAWEKLKPAYLKLYTDAYTKEELDGIIGFYKSPAGQAMVAKSPSLMTKASGIAQQMIAGAQPELRKAITDFVELVDQKKQ